jgi:hypothetical protein
MQGSGSASFAHAVGMLKLHHQVSLFSRRYNFFESTSWSITLSRLKSATGNGSTSNDIKVVADEETVKADQMHVVGLGERQGFSYEASHTLPKGVIEALDVGR